MLDSATPQIRGNVLPAISITGAAAPILRDNVLCAEGEVVSIADTATPDIDESNEICE